MKHLVRFPWPRRHRNAPGVRPSTPEASPALAGLAAGPDEAHDDAATMEAVLSALTGKAEPVRAATALETDGGDAPAMTVKLPDRIPREEPDGAEGAAAGSDASDPAEARGSSGTALDEAVAATVAGAPTGTAPDSAAATLAGRVRAAWAPWRPLRPFLAATLAPVPVLVLAGFFGGLWSLAALLCMTGLLHAIDEVALRRGLSAPGPVTARMADRLSLLLAGLHFLLLPLAVWVLTGATGLGFLDGVATLLAFGLWFGQVSNSNAHELIHRTEKRLFRTGMWVYISLLFGHHTSAHRLVHHRFVATTDDPNTAAAGESFYLFAARAWPGAFVAGYEMEAHRRAARQGQSLLDPHPYAVYIAGGTLWVVAIFAAFGLDGLLAYLLLCAHAQVQLLLSDYVQHYGLLRRELPSGALEPAGIRHSWDAPHPVSGLMMLNAPRHADHHSHTARRYPDLRLSAGGQAPLLPYSLPVMATIALVPPLWHRIMDRRLARLGLAGD